MSSTGEHIRDTALWTWAQVRRMLLIQSIVALLLALCAGFGTYWYASYKDIASRMGDRLPKYENSVNEWIEETVGIFSQANINISDDPRLPSKNDVRKIQEAATKLITQLNSVPTPTSQIERSAADFRIKLNDIVREVGRYDGTPEAATKILRVSNKASEAGSEHKHAIERYLGSALSRLIGSF